MKQQIIRIVNQKWFLPGAAAVGGTIFGYTLGYMRTKSQYDEIEAKLDQLQQRQDELDQTALTAQIKARADAFAKIAKGVEVDQSYLEHPSRGDDLQEKRTANRRPERTMTSEAVVTNIFPTNDGDEWDYKTEIESRDKTRPYVIHIDEYVNDEMGWDNQSTLTWYEKDSILCDSRDRPIYNHTEVVGDLRFGHGSNDANVVYIRNDTLQAEYEILRDEGSYEEIVLGDQLEHQAEEQELKHSNQRRFRDD